MESQGPFRPAGPLQRTHAIPLPIREDWKRPLPQEDCMGTHRIIALDLGKFKTVACVMNAVDRSHVFETIEMSPAAVHDLLVRHATDPASETLVVFETCDCCGWVYDVCAALGLAASVVAANSEAWQWRRVKRKTDRDDALKLAG